MQGLNGLVGVGPAAGGVIEDLVGEEVLIGGVEGGLAGVVEAVGIHLNGVSGICVVLGELVEGGIEIVLHLSPLPLALVVFEKVWFCFGVVEEA